MCGGTPYAHHGAMSPDLHLTAGRQRFADLARVADERRTESPAPKPRRAPSHSRFTPRVRRLVLRPTGGVRPSV